jgi:hypothetical protein
MAKSARRNGVSFLHLRSSIRSLNLGFLGTAEGAGAPEGMAGGAAAEGAAETGRGGDAGRFGRLPGVAERSSVFTAGVFAEGSGSTTAGAAGSARGAARSVSWGGEATGTPGDTAGELG